MNVMKKPKQPRNCTVTVHRYTRLLRRRATESLRWHKRVPLYRIHGIVSSSAVSSFQKPLRSITWYLWRGFSKEIAPVQERLRGTQQEQHEGHLQATVLPALL